MATIGGAGSASPPPRPPARHSRPRWHQSGVPSGRDGTPDWCHLGRLWRAGGPGGGLALPAPPIVAKSLLHVKGAKRQCEVAREFLMAPFVGEPGT